MPKPKLMKLYNKTQTKNAVAYPRIKTDITARKDDAYIVIDNDLSVHSGAKLSFISPANSSTVTHLKISNNDTLYELVDSTMMTIASIEGAFVEGAVVNVVIDEQNKKAFVTNAANTSSFVSGGKNYAFTYNESIGAIGVTVINKKTAEDVRPGSILDIDKLGNFILE